MKLMKCEVCGNVVEYILDSGVPVFCCGQPMTLLIANTTDAATEKHVPVNRVEDGKLIVEVGSVPHPMIPEHYITSIFAVMGNQVLRSDLKPGEKPEAVFVIGDYKGDIDVYEYCNLHGLWTSKITV